MADRTIVNSCMSVKLDRFIAIHYIEDVLQKVSGRTFTHFIDDSLSIEA